MDWYTINGVNYDRRKLTELAIKLNTTGTRLASLFTDESIRFLSNIPCSKPAGDYGNKKDAEIKSIHYLKQPPKTEVTPREDTSSHFSRESSFCDNNVQQDATTIDLPRSGWKFISKFSNKFQNLRYKIYLFTKKSEKLSPLKLKSKERKGRYTGISYEKLIIPSPKYEQLWELNLDNFINDEFTSSSKALDVDDEYLITAKNAILNRHNDTITCAKYKEYKMLPNKLFSETRKLIVPSITFTKLYNLREKLFKLIDAIPDLDPATVAAGWTLFERLVVTNCVSAPNLKLYAGVCLIISFKFYQDDTSNTLSSLTTALPSLDSHSNITVQNIFALELKIFTLLSFNLTLGISKVSKHLNYYLKSQNTTFKDFYDTDPMDQFFGQIAI